MTKKNQDSAPHPLHVKGSATIYHDGAVEFKPSGQGEPVYDDLRRHKNGVTLATTRGTRPKLVARIPVSADSPDPFYAMVDALSEAMPADCPSPVPAMTKVYARRPWRVLLKHDDVLLSLSPEHGRLFICATIDMGRTPLYQNQLFNLFNDINKCLAINETTLRSAVLARQKSGTK